MSLQTTEGVNSDYLTIEASVEEIRSMGFKDTNLRQVQRWANEKKLPFFRFGKRCYIDRQTLRGAFKTMQDKAVSGNN
jgi:hypothetical protein